MSHVKEVLTIQKVTREKVMKLLGWDELQYGKFQMQQAEAYLDYHIGADVWGVQQIKETPGFWAWWRNHWHKRDMQFAEEAKSFSPAERVLFYEITHDAEAMDYTPHSVIMHHTFAREVISGKRTEVRRVKL